MTDNDQLRLVNTDAETPPARCPDPDCRGDMTFVAFHIRVCRRCGWRWERSAQISGDEPWPGEPL